LYFYEINATIFSGIESSLKTKMKRKLLEKQNKLIGFLLSIIGIGSALTFGGCEYGVGPNAMEYGTPSATFKVQGKVSSEGNANIKGIRVVMQRDTALTDVDGKFQVQTNDFPADRDFNIEFDDTDGELNGAFQSMDTIISFVNPKFINPEGSWYQGETTKELNVKLKPKN
jgi:putative lipoprotein (rSAM/lipoprotein system)